MINVDKQTCLTQTRTRITSKHSVQRLDKKGKAYWRTQAWEQPENNENKSSEISNPNLKATFAEDTKKMYLGAAKEGNQTEDSNSGGDDLGKKRRL